MIAENALRSPFRPEGFSFDGLNALAGARCLSCGETFFPARPACLNCSGTRMEPVALSTRGKIYAYTVIHRAPAGFEAPYGCGWVLTDDGVKLWSMFKGSIEKLRVGLEVEMVFDRLGDRTVYFFQPSY